MYNKARIGAERNEMNPEILERFELVQKFRRSEEYGSMQTEVDVLSALINNDGSPEARGVLGRMYYEVAMSHVQRRDFEAAYASAKQAAKEVLRTNDQILRLQLEVMRGGLIFPGQGKGRDGIRILRSVYVATIESPSRGPEDDAVLTHVERDCLVYLIALGTEHDEAVADVEDWLAALKVNPAFSDKLSAGSEEAVAIVAAAQEYIDLRK